MVAEKINPAMELAQKHMAKQMQQVIEGLDQGKAPCFACLTDCMEHGGYSYDLRGMGKIMLCTKCAVDANIVNEEEE